MNSHARMGRPILSESRNRAAGARTILETQAFSAQCEGVSPSSGSPIRFTMLTGPMFMLRAKSAITSLVDGLQGLPTRLD
jgi:hypothetical protein